MQRAVPSIKQFFTIAFREIQTPSSPLPLSLFASEVNKRNQGLSCNVRKWIYRLCRWYFLQKCTIDSRLRRSFQRSCCLTSPSKPFLSLMGVGIERNQIWTTVAYARHRFRSPIFRFRSLSTFPTYVRIFITLSQLNRASLDNHIKYFPWCANKFLLRTIWKKKEDKSEFWNDEIKWCGCLLHSRRSIIFYRCSSTHPASFGISIIAWFWRNVGRFGETIQWSLNSTKLYCVRVRKHALSTKFEEGSWYSLSF